mmetsp:Transcript_60479/g.129757  ORF Transcript_60479/g.129757 Transcript_60479/m.129757 type:complete len:225 (-) Transcript_60479:212-886(-)
MQVQAALHRQSRNVSETFRYRKVLGVDQHRVALLDVAWTCLGQAVGQGYHVLAIIPPSLFNRCNFCSDVALEAEGEELPFIALHIHQLAIREPIRRLANHALGNLYLIEGLGIHEVVHPGVLVEVGVGSISPHSVNDLVLLTALQGLVDCRTVEQIHDLGLRDSNAFAHLLRDEGLDQARSAIDKYFQTILDVAWDLSNIPTAPDYSSTSLTARHRRRPSHCPG